MPTDYPDLAVEMADALFQVLERRPRETVSAHAAEIALISAVKGTDAVRRLWAKTEARLARGMAATEAREVLAATSFELRAWGEFLRVACECGEAASKREMGGIEGLEEAQACRAEVKGLLDQVGEILELLSRPRGRVDPQSLAAAYDAFRRGDARDARDVLAERTARGNR